MMQNNQDFFCQVVLSISVYQNRQQRFLAEVHWGGVGIGFCLFIVFFFLMCAVRTPHRPRLNKGNESIKT